MRRLSLLLLLCAVALSVHALPYSMIPDTIQLGDGFTSKKTSSSSQSNSFAEAKEDNIDITGVYNGRDYTGSKTSNYKNDGGSYSHSSSSSAAKVSGSIPIGLISASSGNSALAHLHGSGAEEQVSGASYGAFENPGTGSLNLEQSAGSSGSEQLQDFDYSQQAVYGINGVSQSSSSTPQPDNVAQVANYWWKNQNNPFGIHNQPTGGQFAVTNHDESKAQQQGIEIKFQGNPFLRPQIASSGSTGFGTSASSGGTTFGTSASSGGAGFGTSTLSGVSGFSSTAFGSANSAAGGSSSSGSATFNQGSNSQGHVVGASNPFFATRPIAATGLTAGSAAGSTGQGQVVGQVIGQHGHFGQHEQVSEQHGQVAGQYGQIAGQYDQVAGQYGQVAGNHGHVLGQQEQETNVHNGQGFQQQENVNGQQGLVIGQQEQEIVGQYGQSIEQQESVSGASAGNPFLRPQAPRLPQFQQNHQNPQIQSGQERETIIEQQASGFTGFDSQRESASGSDGGLSVSCNGQDNICVAKHLCSAKGYVTSNDLTQVRSGPQQCRIATEVCCTLKSSDSTVAGSFGTSSISTSFGTAYGQNGVKNTGGIFGNANAHRDLTVHGTDESNNAGDANGYLPPLGSEPSSNVPAFSKPPAEEVEPEGSDASPSNFRPQPQYPEAPPPPPQIGCAAALICVEEQFCTIQGVISPSPVALTSEQLLRRAPLSSCKNPDNGIIGKCCRDPNYVDPWPAGNLPANYSGGFDEQGFPTYLNIAKTRPPKKQLISSVKIGQPTKTVQRPQNAQPDRVPAFTSQVPHHKVANQISTSFTNVYHQPTPAPEIGSSSLATFSRYPVVRPTTGPPIIHQNFPAFSTTKAPIVQHSFPAFSTTKAPIVQHSFSAFSPTEAPIVHQSFPAFSTTGAPIVQHSFPTFLPTEAPIIHSSIPVYPSTAAPIGQTSFNQIHNFPSLPTFRKSTFDTSPTNENPIIITSHKPGSQCGLRNKVYRPEVLSDVDVAFGEIPWQAMILSINEKKLLCSGAIISQNAIVTAARCIDGYSANEIAIKTGEWKLGYELKHEEPLPFEIINVAAIQSYPGWSAGNPSNDVAILFLEHDIRLDQHVDLLCLPEVQSLPKPGSKCIATGWGKIILQVHAAGALMHSVDVDILDNEQCQQRLQGAESQIELDDNVICTKAHKQNNNMCQVDLGGPLACDRGDGYYEFAGVYNQDTGCLPTNQIATFSTVSMEWMKEIISHPPQYFGGESQLPANVIQQQQFVRNNEPTEPCDCQKSNLQAQNNQYLPPQ